jgi:hypothetical protein
MIMRINITNLARRGYRNLYAIYILPFCDPLTALSDDIVFSNERPGVR